MAQSFEAWRSQVAQSVARGSSIATIAGIACTSISRTWMVSLTGQKPWQEAATETLWYLFNFILLCSPAAAVRSGGRLASLHEQICVLSHIARSCSLALISAGLVPFMETAHTMLRLHMEVAIEAALASQDQLSLPIMALLHAIRQATWMSIVLWRQNGDLYHCLVRGVINWSILCLLSYVFERRMWASYKEHCRTIQQQQLQKQPQGRQPQPATSFTGTCGVYPERSASRSASLVKSAEKAACYRPVYTTEKESQACGQEGACELEPMNVTSAAAAHAGHAASTEPAAAASGAEPAPAAASNTEPAAAAAASTETAGSLSTTEPAAATARRGAAGNGDGSQTPSPPPEQNGADEGQAVLPLILRRDRAYVSPLGPHTIVCVKIRGVQLEQLPSNAAGAIQESAKTMLPDAILTSMALRTGCVMITLDLCTSAWYMGKARGGGVTLSVCIMHLVTHLMRQGMGRFLHDGAAMYIQTPEELALYQWNSSTGTYQAMDDSLLPLATFAAASQLPRMLPATHCLSTSVQLDSAAQVTITVELQLPSNCQLYGWQPAGVAAPAGSGEVLLEDGAVMHAMLLARRLDGGYLPVVVERVVRVDMGSDAKATAHHTIAQVTITVGSSPPAALCFELWCKPTALTTKGGRVEPGLELLVSHMPLLVLPSSWKEAAAELQQHIVETGGVQPRNALPPHARDVSRQAASEGQSGCLLEDLGMWLTHHHRSAGKALPDSVMSQMGDDLLMYAVRHGLGAVAGMIVDTMQRSQQQDVLGPTIDPPCNDQESTELFEVILAAGRALKQPRSTIPMAMPSWGFSSTSPVA